MEEKKKMGIAKKITLIILMTTFFTGLLGCFLVFFDMDKFETFVNSFTFMYGLLIVSIGVNSGISKFKEGK